jgi:hypothetical protein
MLEKASDSFYYFNPSHMSSHKATQAAEAQKERFFRVFLKEERKLFLSRFSSKERKAPLLSESKALTL